MQFYWAVGWISSNQNIVQAIKLNRARLSGVDAVAAAIDAHKLLNT